jgi:hypothetical protein
MEHGKGIIEFRIDQRNRNWSGIDIFILLIPIGYSLSLYIVPTIQLQVYFLLIFVGWIYLQLTRIKRESMILLEHVGIQLTSESLVSTTTIFLPIQEIKRIVIQEGIHQWKVRYYLSIITTSRGILVCFPVQYSHLASLTSITYSRANLYF